MKKLKYQWKNIGYKNLSVLQMFFKRQTLKFLKLSGTFQSFSLLINYIF